MSKFIEVQDNANHVCSDRHDLYAYLSSLVSYDKDNGIFTWLKRDGQERSIKIWNTRFSGKECGTINSTTGYRQFAFKFNGKTQFIDAHRLAWFVINGNVPLGEIDHIDRIKLNNRIENLRDVPACINQRNSPMQRNNTSGVTGVNWHKIAKKWRAEVKVNSKRIYLGLFSDILEAKSVVNKFRLDHEFSITHGE